MMIDTGTIKATSVQSATKTHLFYSILMMFMMVALEAVSIWHCFFRAETFQDVGLMAIVQIPMLLVALVPITHIPAYKRRRKFTMYFTKLENADMALIKDKYYICHIDDYGVIFVSKKDARLYDDWKLLYEVCSSRAIEQVMFEMK